MTIFLSGIFEVEMLSWRERCDLQITGQLVYGWQVERLGDCNGLKILTDLGWNFNADRALLQDFSSLRSLRSLLGQNVNDVGLKVVLLLLVVVEQLPLDQVLLVPQSVLVKGSLPLG